MPLNSRCRTLIYDQKVPIILRITRLPRVRESTSRKGGAILTVVMGYRGIYSVGII